MSTVLEPPLLEPPALELLLAELLLLELLPQALSAATVPKTRHPLVTLTRKLTFLLLCRSGRPSGPVAVRVKARPDRNKGCAGFFGLRASSPNQSPTSHDRGGTWGAATIVQAALAHAS